jgi:hypothetical protein
LKHIQRFQQASYHPPEFLTGGHHLMSHIVTLRTRIHDPVAVVTACQRLGLAAPGHGKTELFSGEVTGLLLTLPGWLYPAVIDTASGDIQFDNYGGAWGDQVHLDRFVQRYAVEKARLEANKLGHRVWEEALQDGSIKLQIIEGET